MFSSQSPQENGESPKGDITLKDANGKTLECYIEHSLELEGCEYLLLLPVDSPIEIVAWDEDDDEDLADASLVEDEAELDLIFPDAQAVLAEQNLQLKRTAFTLTVAGELPPVDEDDILTLEIEDDNVPMEAEELQELASFYYKEQEYGIYTPVEPLLFFARSNQSGQPELLSTQEIKQVQPMLEELLFDDLE
ncbi:MAG: DUF3727 domain-containing protein [Moorea sp. SIO1F2]|uniref:DUF3727 domain-containing protein n=1 Tax=unclassified Moorena TaxID=2683338 RepID=UPI0013B5E28F|nr:MULTISPECIES: DUF3727 domain-containing protein [unclassified Moorena]NEN97269.1 DUF3727 domain-containing protein [Moorena sp. SIO3I7]NEO09031.1 DUF3727 domain-containing protein [Moorena sp. SIO3I8]NEO17901.1 DUF3727 domain-containing protein [Moorena sp. SIO4A5]NEP21949.1 DUF3727 domain-containing protein [Moorena sp. SIO3I6]NEQ59851.1 DUF3727 domain-containing protein [Moorena sp. SIO4A1]